MTNVEYRLIYRAYGKICEEMQNSMKTVEQLKKEVAETKLPQATKELFYKVLDTADESRLSESQRMRYESDLKNYMDTMSCIEFAEIKGKAEGRAEGKAEEKAAIAKSMKEKGIAASLIAECTGIPEDVMAQL